MLDTVKKLVVLLGLVFVWNSYAVTIKIGVLAPDGTSWAKNLKKMSKEIKKATKGGVKLKIYYGGSQGDEPDVLRKIRIGQLHGGIFSGKTLGEINGDVRVMEVPFTFRGDREKAYKTLGKMTPTFNKGFNKQGFENLGFFEIGRIYLVSKKPIAKLKDLYSLKIWTWTGDPIVEALIESMKLVSVPLSLPDVLSSLSTGILDAAYSPPLAIIALQWSTKIKYLLDFPLTYSVGAFLVDSRRWRKISPANQKIVQEISKRYFVKVKDANVKENADSKEALKSFGVKFVNFPKEDYKQIDVYRDAIIKRLKGKLFSQEVYDEFNRARK
jgi:TRAP-type transport system periplasmic protein